MHIISENEVKQFKDIHVIDAQHGIDGELAYQTLLINIQWALVNSHDSISSYVKYNLSTGIWAGLTSDAHVPIMERLKKTFENSGWTVKIGTHKAKLIATDPEQKIHIYSNGEMYHNNISKDCLSQGLRLSLSKPMSNWEASEYDYIEIYRERK